MKITYDKIADAMYIYLSKAKVFRTIKMNETCLVDIDKKGKVLGIEILSASSQISKKNLLASSVNIQALA